MDAGQWGVMLACCGGISALAALILFLMACVVGTRDDIEQGRIIIIGGGKN